MRVRLAAALLALAVASGCASVPGSSPVQVLRQVGSDDPASAPGPVDGSNPLDLVRDFVTASGSSTDKHAAARAFLAPEAARWDDSAVITVLDGQIDTVPAPNAADFSSGASTIRIRGTEIGRITATGSFEPAQSSYFLDVDVVRRNGQWRISRLPDGVVVPLTILRDHYRTVHTWFIDPVRRLAVADLRYLPGSPASAQAARATELLLAGPSGALLGAAVSQLPAGAKLRANLAVDPDGALVVDLTRTGTLDENARRLLAAQVVLSLAELNNDVTVRVLIDGEPVLPDHPEWTRNDVSALSADVQPASDVPALVVAGGRVSQLPGPGPSAPLPGPVGNGGYDAVSAASSDDGQHLAVVTRTAAGETLLVGGGPDGGVVPVAVTAPTMTRPTWTPAGNEVWTVLGALGVARVTLDTNGKVRTGQVNVDELAALGPITDLRISRDGMRVAAVVGGGLYTAAVARSIDGEVAIRNIRRLRSGDLGAVAAADWRSAETLVAITQGPVPQVVQVSVDGLTMTAVPGNNLTPPLTAVAAAPNRPLLVTDQGGVWSFDVGEQNAWRPLGGGPAAVPVYPG